MLGAVVVSGQDGSGTFIATLVNNSPDEATSMDSLAGAGDDAVTGRRRVRADRGAGPRGLVNLADDQGVPVTGELQRPATSSRCTSASSNGERVTMRRAGRATDSGYFAGLDTSAPHRGRPPAERPTPAP